MIQWNRAATAQPDDGAAQFVRLLRDPAVLRERDLFERVLAEAGIPPYPPAGWEMPRRCARPGIRSHLPTLTHRRPQREPGSRVTRAATRRSDPDAQHAAPGNRPQPGRTDTRRWPRARWATYRKTDVVG